MKKGCWRCNSNAPEPEKPPEPEREFVVAFYNISGSADALQPRGGLFKLLSELDETRAESYLSLDGASLKLRSPFSGLLLSLEYNPIEVVDLVDGLWPEQVLGHPGPGRKSLDRLPIVCYLLSLFDPDHGVITDLQVAHRRLKEDEEYRARVGFADRLPSYSVFAATASKMKANWALFQACHLSPQDLKTLQDRFNCAGGVEPSPFAAELLQLGWNGTLPLGFLDDEKASKALRVVGRPRGRGCKSTEDSVDLGSVAPPADDGSTTSFTKTLYPRDWPGYNNAQTHEFSDVLILLRALSDLINLMEYRFQGPRGRGRPWFPLGHAVFSVILKVYSGMASRRLESLLREVAEWGYLRNVPPCRAVDGADPIPASGTVRIPQFNTVSHFLRADWLTPLLLELVTITARPLRGVEHEFAVDGTGWSTRWYDRWLDKRLAAESDRQQWVKLHLVVGTETNVVARAAISPGSHHDGPYFRPLVIETAKHFDVEMVLADMAYSSHANYALGRELDILVRIPFKSNTRPPKDDGSEWSRNLKYFLGNLREVHGRISSTQQC